MGQSPSSRTQGNIKAAITSTMNHNQSSTRATSSSTTGTLEHLHLTVRQGEIENTSNGKRSGAALPHSGRDGKGRDTCSFYPFDNFFVHFLPFFAPMSPDFAHCVTC